MCSIIRRNEFDFLLVQTAAERGVAIRQGEKVVQLIREPSGIRVVTEKATYCARIVVGADGSEAGATAVDWADPPASR